MKSKLLLIIVLILDAVAVGLAIVAEFKRNKSWIVTDKEMNYKYCIYGSNIATGFGVVASSLLTASHVLIMLATRRYLFCWHAPGRRVLFLYLASWALFSAAEACLLVASLKNAYRNKYRTVFFVDDVNLACRALRRGVFAAGAGLSFLTAIASVFFYVCYSNSSEIQPSKTDSDPDSGHVKDQFRTVVSSVNEKKLEESDNGLGLELDSSEPIQNQGKVKECLGSQ